MIVNLTNISFPQRNTAFSDVNKASDMWYWVLSAIAALLTVVGNIVVIYLISTRRRLHFTTNFFILSLAVADLCVGAFVIPSYMLCSLKLDCPFTLLTVFYNQLLYIVVCNMFVMTWDRFVAVTKPFKYRSWMTTRRLLSLISIAWFVPGILSLCPLLWMYSSSTEAQRAYWTVFYSVTMVVFEWTPCVGMLLIYCRVFAIVRKHSRQISLQLGISKSARGESKGITRRKLEKSGVKAVGFVVLFFVFCYSLSVYRAMCTQWKLCTISRLTTRISRLFLFWNSALNFFVYALLKKDIRRELLKCLPWTSTEGVVIPLETTIG